MKKLLFLVALAALSMPLLAGAQSAFDGTWKADMNKVDFPKKPDVFLLQNGMYECKTCAPPYKVKADGTDQSVSGSRLAVVSQAPLKLGDWPQRSSPDAASLDSVWMTHCDPPSISD